MKTGRRGFQLSFNEFPLGGFPLKFASNFLSVKCSIQHSPHATSLLITRSWTIFDELLQVGALSS